MFIVCSCVALLVVMSHVVFNSPGLVNCELVDAAFDNNNDKQRLRTREGSRLFSQVAVSTLTTPPAVPIRFRQLSRAIRPQDCCHLSVGLLDRHPRLSKSIRR